jgi:hypothetical protein
MKRTFVIVIAAALFACNSSDDKTSKEEPKKDDAKVAGMSTNDLAYQVKDWGDWEKGSMENLKMALQSLKDWENGNIDASLASFADTVKLSFDEMQGTSGIPRNGRIRKGTGTLLSVWMISGSRTARSLPLTKKTVTSLKRRCKLVSL